MHLDAAGTTIKTITSDPGNSGDAITTEYGYRYEPFFGTMEVSMRSPSAVTNSAGETTNRTTKQGLNVNGDVLLVFDASRVGSVATTTYDAAGRPVKTEDGDRKTTTYNYDPATGLVNKRTDERGDFITVYDSAGNRVSIKNAEGDSSQWVYDELGRVIKDIKRVPYERAAIRHSLHPNHYGSSRLTVDAIDYYFYDGLTTHILHREASNIINIPAIIALAAPLEIADLIPLTEDGGLVSTVTRKPLELKQTVKIQGKKSVVAPRPGESWNDVTADSFPIFTNYKYSTYTSEATKEFNADGTLHLANESTTVGLNHPNTSEVSLTYDGLGRLKKSFEKGEVFLTKHLQTCNWTTSPIRMV